VQPPLDIPFVESQPNTIEILFLWDSIANASGYQVEVIAGSSGVLNGTNYFVDGLMPEDSVSLVVTALSDNYCPPAVTDTITCYAVDCPQITLEILAQDTSICYDGSGVPFILPHIIDPDDFGTITWSGNGIIDSDTGLFHPDSAGYGTHTILLSHQYDVCVKNVQATIRLYEIPTADFNISSDSICNTDLLTINYTGNAPGGNPTWDFNNPDNLNGQDLGQHTAGWDTEGWKTISLQVERNGCLSDVETHMVYVEEALPEIEIDCESSVDSIVFSWPDNTQIEEYEIYINGNLEDIQDINKWTINNLDEGDVVQISLVGINSGICANTTGELECEAEACPVFAVEFTPVVDSICLVPGISPIQFEADLTGGTQPGDIVWSGNGIDPVTGLFDPVTAGPGTHTISYSYAEGSCDIDTSFTFTLVEQPETDFVIDESVICITDLITVTNNAYNPNFEYHWDFGSANVNQLSDEMYELTWDQDGSFDVSLYVNNALCESALESYNITVEPELLLPAISIDSTSQSITLNWFNVDCASSYQIYVDGNLATETTDVNYTIMGLDPAQTVTIDFVVVSECECPDVSITFDATTQDCEDLELSIEELPYAACADELTANMSLHAVIVGTQNGDIEWTGNSITTNGSEGIIDLTALSAGEYYYTISYDLDNCEYEFTDVLTINPSVNMDASATDPSCNGTSDGNIQILANGGTTPFTYLMDGVQTDTSFVEDLQAGNYSFEVADINGCKDDIQVTLIDPPFVVPEISGLDLLQENVSGNYSLNFASTPVDAYYTWYFTGGDTICAGPECISVDIAITDDVELCVNVAYNGKQCEESDCFEIRFEKTVDVYIPNVFSPNNDDRNDFFFIQSDESVVLIKSMSIFDRWGELVFKRTNFVPNEEDLGWNGKFNGKSLNPGVFVYDILILTEEDKELRYTGDITLIR
jgi:gliding motility-associated-like protein